MFIFKMRDREMMTMNFQKIGIKCCRLETKVDVEVETKNFFCSIMKKIHLTETETEVGDDES